MNILDQNGRLKGKVSRPKTDAEEVHRFERSLYAGKRDLYTLGTGVKQLPQQFYTVYRSRRGGNNEIYQELAMNGDEHGKNSKNPNADLFYGVTRAYGCWRVAEVAAVYLVTSG